WSSDVCSSDLFSALVDPSTGRYLVEDAAITILPSAGVLTQARRDARTTSWQSGFAFAPFPGELPANLGEVEAFRRLAPGATIASGGAAHESAVRRALTL